MTRRARSDTAGDQPGLPPATCCRWPPWRPPGVTLENVVVATGPATRTIVDSFGFAWTHLRLGRGSNPGLIRAPSAMAQRSAEAARRRGGVCVPIHTAYPGTHVRGGW